MYSSMLSTGTQNGFKHGFSNRFINTSKGNWHGITKDSNMDPKADSKRILDGFKKDQKQIQKEFVSLNSGSVAKKSLCT